MIAELLSIIAPTFLCVAIGFVWSRRGAAYDRALITDLIMNIGAPCLVFSQLVSLDGGAAEVARIAGIALVAMSLFAALGGAVLLLAGLPLRTYLPPLVFANTGNLGLPLCLFALGPEGLALAVGYFAATSIAHFTVGVAIWSGRPALRESLTNPLALATLIAAVVVLSGVPVPGFVLDTTRLLGGFTIPLMLLTLGVSIGQMHVARLPRPLALAVMRLGMGAGVGVALAAVFSLEGAARSVVIIDCAMPAAVFNYLMAQRYERSPEEIASVVVLSTLLAFALLPAWLAFAL